jgi:hypothetical protein
MHYFRRMRTGSFELREKGRAERTHNSAGYQMITIPGHPLEMANGYTYEHRAVVYARYGETLPPCEICGRSLTWSTAHIDHIDEVVTNNEVSNLRPLCHTCNTRRGRDKIPEYMRKGRIAVTYDGETKTPNEWARDPRISVSGASIKRRKRQGMSDYDSLFSPKITHNGKLPVKKPTPPKYTRKNSISLEWMGEKKTPAEWARDPRVFVSDGTIRNRFRSGLSVEECLFSPPNIGGWRGGKKSGGGSMTHQIPAYATSELLRLEREIAEHEQAIARKNEQRREIINRYSLNKLTTLEEVVGNAYSEIARRRFSVEVQSCRD